MNLLEGLVANMINIFAKRGFTDTWNSYFHDWGGMAEHDFDIHTYEDLAGLQELPAGPIIFGDIERLTAADRALVSDVARVISETRPEIPILNSPTKTLRRYDLLAELHKAGLNPFRAYRLTDTTTPDRFPVFLRYENDHTGATTGLLHNQRELDRAIVRAQIRQHDLRDLIVVEFVNTCDASGIFAKYSAYIVGDVIVPRGAELSADWVVKFGVSIRNPDTATFALDYVRANPHVSLLRQRFDLGGVGYGRIDYSMLGDSIVTWEINTNPTIMSTRQDTHPTSLPRQELFLSSFNSAFESISPKDRNMSPISLSGVSPRLRAASRSERPATRSPIRRFGRKHKRWFEPAVRSVEIASVPFEQQILNRWKRESAN